MVAVSLRAKQTEVSAGRGVDPSQWQHESAQATWFVPPVTLSGSVTLLLLKTFSSPSEAGPAQPTLQRRS